MPVATSHHALRDAVQRAGGTLDAAAVLTHVPRPVRAPFGDAAEVEHAPLRAVDVQGPGAVPSEAAFLDGIQRYAVVGRFDLAPVVRGYAAAAVLVRSEGTLAVAAHLTEEFVVAPLTRLDDAQCAALEATGLEVFDSGSADEPHPLLDMESAAHIVERRREEAERRAAREYLARTEAGWLVVDGSIDSYDDDEHAGRLLGLVKSHETQFLRGGELTTALTLPAGFRTSVFARMTQKRKRALTWYLRLWPWEGHDLYHGLLRLERPPSSPVVAEATALSRWLLAERAPLSTPDGRWDRLIYPIHQVETYLKAQAGAWA